MSNQRSYIALNWVTEEIVETLQQAKQALNSFIDNPHDITKLRFCLTYIHQVTGGLVMVELHSASVLSKTIEALVADIIKAVGGNIQQAHWLTAVDEAIAELADYVSHVNSTHQDDAGSLLDTINRLRQLNQLEELGAAEMFDPNIEAARVTQKQKPRMTKNDFNALVYKLDKAYQHALSHLSSGVDVNKNLALLNKIAASLYKVSRSTVSEPLWQIVFAIAEYLQAFPSELDEQSLKALRLAYQEVMSLKHSSIDGLATTPSSQLIKTLLYSVATAENTTASIQQLKEQYQLDLALSGSEKKLSLEDKIIMAFVNDYSAAKNQKEALFAVSQQQSDDFVATALGSAEKSTSTLEALNPTDRKLFATEYFRYIKEAAQQLDIIKEHIVAYINSEFDGNHIQHLPALLLQQAKTLFISTTYQLSPVLLAARIYIEELNANKKQASNKDLELLADTISAVEYYLECLIAESPDKLASILERARQCVLDLRVAEEQVDLRLLTMEAPIVASPDVALTDDKVVELPEAKQAESEPLEDDFFVLTGDVDEEILEIFIEEANEVLADITENLPALEADYGNTDVLLDIRRGFHTLKGSGRMVGAEHIGDFAWSVEDALNKIRDGLFALNADVLILIRNAIAKLPDILASLEQRRPYPLQLIRETVEQAAWVLEGKPLTLDTETTPSSSGNDSNAELLHIFISEAETHIQTFTDFLDSISLNFEDAYISNDMQRAMHTLKGSAYMADMMNMAELATPLESLVKDMANFQSVVDADMLALLIRAGQAFEQQLADLREGYDRPIYKQAELVEDIKRMHANMMENHQAEAEESNVLADKYTALLSKALDSMTDSAALLILWRNEGISVEQQQKLLDAVKTLSDTAAQANYQAIEQVASALSALYQHAMMQPQVVGNEFFELANNAQEELEDMMDIIAAQQTAECDPELLAMLSHFVAGHIAEEQDPEEEVDTLTLEPELAPHKPEHGKAITDSAVNSLGNISLLAEELSQADEELLEIFVEELTDLTEELELVAQPCLQKQLIEQAQIDELKRILHTVKGGARMTELSALGDITHDYETLLESAERKQNFDQEFFGEFANYHHQMMVMVDAVFNPAAIQLPAVEAELVPTEPEVVELADAEPVNVASEVSLTSEDDAADDLVQQPLEPESIAQSSLEPIEREVEQADDVTEQPVAAELELTLEQNVDEGWSIDSELLELFVDEVSGQLAELDDALDKLIKEDEKSPHLDEMKRLLHTIKGGARMVGATRIGDISHDFETFIIESENDNTLQQEQTIRALQEFNDNLCATFNYLTQTEAAASSLPSSQTDAAHPEEVTTANVVPIRKDVDIREVPQAAIEATRKFIDSFNQEQQRATRRESVRVDPEVLETLINLAGENIIGRARLEEQMSELRFSLDEMDSTIDRLHAQLRRLEIETEAQITFRQEQVGIEGLESFDPLEMDRYSHMQQLSKSLIEAASDIDDLSATFTGKMRDMDTLLLQQARVNTELQEGLMRFQMVPFSRMVPRLRRIIRQISQEVGKHVDLTIENAEGELDRTVLEKMVAPLEHMLRNAVDHGIEAPETRRSQGKPENGTVTIHLSREGGEVVLAISDDGAGVNLQAVRNKAIERGLLSADANISDSEVLQFILAAGFSTAESVTQISGRGVGMDVVNSEIKQIGGSISIDSEAGKGTTFIVRLPFTVSINRALMVGIGTDTFAIPLTSIEGIVRVSPYELEAYYQPDAPMFDYAGQSYNLRYLGSLLHRGQAKIGEVITPLPVVLIRSSDYAVAVQVDRLLGSREIVVKSLGPQFSMVQGLSGATVLGDGSVVVILDMMALIRSDISKGLLSEADAIASKEVYQETPESKVTRVMVVDDSVTVRKVTSRLLERYGLDVDVARDGLDAITQLLEAESLPDIMLLDIEMPRMDGFEVLSRLRHNERLQHIPVVMITSRTGEKHRERALSLGANRYLGKPFQESELLQTIGELTQTDILQVQ